MDELRGLSQYSFAQWAQFKRSACDKPVKIMSLNCDENGSSFHPATEKLSEASLMEKLSSTPSSESTDRSTKASVRVVVVSRAEDDSIDMTKDRFEELVRRFNIDPSLLPLISLSGYGFHHCEEPFNEATSFYVGTYIYSLLWSVNPSTMETNAILLLRTTRVLGNGDYAFKGFQGTLGKFKQYACTPMFLLMVFYIHLSRLSQEAVYKNVTDLRKMEHLTGHGPGHGIKLINGAEYTHAGIDELSAAAQDIATAQVHLANLLRHEVYLKDIAEYLQEPEILKEWKSRVSSEAETRWEADFAQLQRLIRPLSTLVSDLEPTLKFLQTRAACQSNVISSMMTHEDARRSTELAAAAKKDSSAMKSIAIMTMVFLPGTFFAALFAMPSMLPAGQKHFWLYWLCSIPATVLVLVVWKYHGRFLEAKAKRAMLAKSQAARRSNSGYSSKAEILIEESMKPV